MEPEEIERALAGFEQSLQNGSYTQDKVIEQLSSIHAGLVDMGGFNHDLYAQYARVVTAVKAAYPNMFAASGGGGSTETSPKSSPGPLAARAMTAPGSAQGETTASEAAETGGDEDIVTEPGQDGLAHGSAEPKTIYAAHSQLEGFGDSGEDEEGGEEGPEAEEGEEGPEGQEEGEEKEGSEAGEGAEGEDEGGEESEKTEIEPEEEPEEGDEPEGGAEGKEEPEDEAEEEGDEGEEKEEEEEPEEDEPEEEGEEKEEEDQEEEDEETEEGEEEEKEGEEGEDSEDSEEKESELEETPEADESVEEAVEPEGAVSDEADVEPGEAEGFNESEFNSGMAASAGLDFEEGEEGGEIEA